MKLLGLLGVPGRPGDVSPAAFSLPTGKKFDMKLDMATSSSVRWMRTYGDDALGPVPSQGNVLNALDSWSVFA